MMSIILRIVAGIIVIGLIFASQWLSKAAMVIIGIILLIIIIRLIADLFWWGRDKGNW